MDLNCAVARVAPSDDLPGLGEGAYRTITELIFRHTGIRLGPGREYFVECRMADLFRSLACLRWEQLPGRIEASPQGVDALIRAVVTPETRFFRDDGPFRALRGLVLPQILRAGVRPFPVRLWSAGCSTGQEAYSAAMVLWGLVADGTLDLSIWATDICKSSLQRAEGGVYSEYDLSRGVGAEERRLFFEDAGAGAARVIEPLRAVVRFEQVNLQRPPCLAEEFHVVFCRNVGIYFDRDGKQRLYAALGEALLPGGYLVLGAAETLFPGMAGFETVYFENLLLYRKASGGPS